MHSTASATPDELAKSLVAHLPILVGHLDPLESLLSMLSGSSGRQQSCAGHMTRLSLHVHWTVLSVLYRLAPTAGEGNVLLDCAGIMLRIIGSTFGWEFCWNKCVVQCVVACQ